MRDDPAVVAARLADELEVRKRLWDKPVGDARRWWIREYARVGMEWTGPRDNLPPYTTNDEEIDFLYPDKSIKIRCVRCRCVFGSHFEGAKICRKCAYEIEVLDEPYRKEPPKKTLPSVPYKDD